MCQIRVDQVILYVFRWKLDFRCRMRRELTRAPSQVLSVCRSPVSMRYMSECHEILFGLDSPEPTRIVEVVWLTIDRGRRSITALL